MPTLIEFQIEGSESVLVEVEGEPSGGLVPVADTDVAGKSTRTFEQAVSGLGPITNAIFGALRSIAIRPAEIAVELGFKISGKGTLILCSTEAEANFKATLKWTGAASSS
jgi:hypothetical protein